MLVFYKIDYIICITINEIEAGGDTEAETGSRNLVRVSVSLVSLLMSGFES
jgi:hypothetical protein